MDGKQIGEILKTSQNIHNGLRDAIHEQSKRLDEERLGTALAYLNEVEQKADAIITESLGSQHKEVLNTFIRYYPVEQEEKALKLVENCARLDTASLMKTMIQTRQQLVEIYDFCARNAHLPEVADLMENICKFETEQMQELGQQMTDYPFGQ